MSGGEERLRELERHLLTCDGHGVDRKREYLEEYVALRRTPAPEAAGGGQKGGRRIDPLADDLALVLEPLICGTKRSAHGRGIEDCPMDFDAESKVQARLYAEAVIGVIEARAHLHGTAAQDGEREYRCACYGGAADGRCGDCGNPCSPFRTQDGERPAGEERRTVQRRQGERRKVDTGWNVGHPSLRRSQRPDRRIATEDRRKG